MYWSYSALSRTGEIIHGAFEGNHAQVVAFVEGQSLIVVDIKHDYRRFIGACLKIKHLKSSVLAQFFDDCYNMMDTGIALNQILMSLKETTKDQYLQEILATAYEQMREGENLTQALGKHKAFPWIVKSTLEAGENSGRLKEAVEILARYFKRSTDIKSKVSNAAIYPVVVFLLLIAIMIFVSLKVVPKLQALLPPEAMGNMATRIILSSSIFLQKTWFLWLFAFVVGGFCLWQYYQENRDRLQHIYYRLPLAGELMKESALALYFLNLSVLLQSGVPLMKAIGELENSLGDFISRKLSVCRQYMLGGASFSEALKKDDFFPVIVSFTLRKAEETAQIGQYCQNLSDFFSKRSQAHVDTMVHLIQPVLLIIGGLFLVLIAFAFLLPIYGSLTKIAGG